MGKKATILVTVCVMITVVVFFEFFVFRTPVQQTISVDEFASNPSAWLNREVTVEGKLLGPFDETHIFGGPPWNYEFFSSDAPNPATSPAPSFFTGVSWNSTDQYNFVNATILGVVRENATWGYYIEAEIIGS